jgi:hypothetical protein
MSPERKPRDAAAKFDALAEPIIEQTFEHALR